MYYIQVSFVWQKGIKKKPSAMATYMKRKRKTIKRTHIKNFFFFIAERRKRAKRKKTKKNHSKFITMIYLYKHTVIRRLSSTWRPLHCHIYVSIWISLPYVDIPPSFYIFDPVIRKCTRHHPDAVDERKQFSLNIHLVLALHEPYTARIQRENSQIV